MPGEDVAKRYIGIDLGTTYSAAAWLDPHGTPITLNNAEDEPTTPSVVLFETSGEMVVGREAKRAALVVPGLVADHVKRDMGEPHYHKRINYRFFSPASISALILKKLKQDAEKRIGPVAGAVITVPAYFDEKRRRATAAAGEIAGLKVIDILNEPTAAALAYAFRDFVNRGGRPDDVIGRTLATTSPHTAVVYDLGGGTFDVTVLRIAGDELTVLATDGDAKLGGRDFDEAVVDWAAERFVKRYRTDPRSNPHSFQSLFLAAEEAKKDLSKLQRTRMLVSHGGESMVLEMTRDEFNAMTAALLERTRDRVNKVIAETGLTWPQVDEVLAVGGSSRMPQVLRMLREVTGKEPNCSLPPGEAVAQGAAIHAAIKAVDLWNAQRARGTPPTDVPTPAPEPLPAPFADGPRAPDPADPSGADVFSQVIAPADEMQLEPGEAWDDNPAPDKDRLLQEMLSDEMIDLGLGEDPAKQFDDRVGRTLRRFHKTDVNAHTLGVMVTRSEGGRGKSVLIPRNTPLPASMSKTYGTMHEDQPEVVVRIVEGESMDLEACSLLGVCRIRPLPPGLPKGSPVEVTFTLDSSGRLHVKAIELSSGRYVTTTILSDGGISGDKMDRAKRAVGKIAVL